MAVTVGFESILDEITTPALGCIRSRTRDFPHVRILDVYVRLPPLRISSTYGFTHAQAAPDSFEGSAGSASRQECVTERVAEPFAVFSVGPPARRDECFEGSLGAERPEDVRGTVGGDVRAESVAVREQFGESVHSCVALLIVCGSELGELIVGGGRLVENAEQWSDPGPHSGLSSCVAVELMARVGFIDDSTDGFALFHGYLAALCAAGECCLHGRCEQACFAGGCPVDGLDGDTGASGDRGDRRAYVSVLQEHRGSGIDDARVVLRRSRSPVRRVVATLGPCVFRH